MYKKRILVLIMVLTIVITSMSIVSAGLFDFNNSNNSNIKTHEYNYANKAVFNLSDELTNKTGVENIVFGQGVSYEYPDKNGKGLVNMLGGLAHTEGNDNLQYYQNTAFYKEIKSNATQQGYNAYIFKNDNFDEYHVLIDMKNITIVDSGGFEGNYDYFAGTFKTLDEAQIFVKTFKLNESAIKK